MLVFQGNYKRLATGDYATKRTQAHVEHLKRSIFGQWISTPGGRWGARVGRSYIYDSLLNFLPLRAGT